MTAATAVDLHNPFPGLRPFREEESDRFFGQEDSIESVLTGCPIKDSWRS